MTRRLIQHEHAPNPGLVWQDCDCRDIHPNDTPCVVCAARFGPVRFEAGDTLWVRETWRTVDVLDDVAPSDMDPDRTCVWYDADDPEGDRREGDHGGDPRTLEYVTIGRGRPSIHMPRWASRLTLHVVSVRAERLRDIDDEDSMREGCDGHSVDGHGGYPVGGSPRDEFRDLWDSINGERPGASWSDNPWVWRVEFKRAADAAGCAS